MAQLHLLPDQSPITWTVADITRYLRDLIESDYNLQEVWVAGEVSNFSQPRSGHLYFTLKDSTAALRCVMWRSSAIRLKVMPKDGEAIEVHGSLGIYEAGGNYQLYVDVIRHQGEGALFQEFLRLKARLEAEGLFKPERKRPIPSFPQRIGVVTSPTGAAFQDILNVLRRRFPLAEVILAPTAVQGSQAPKEIVTAIENINQTVKPDVIILARGGGSIEDLWAFNDELVARAIVNSLAPIISGIGHETDFTIADFAADIRAPTPTAAAEMATPNQADLQEYSLKLKQRLDRGLVSILDSQKMRLAQSAAHLEARSPQNRLRSARQRIDELAYRVDLALSHCFNLHRTQLQGIQHHLASLNPISILQRGYAIVTTPTGVIVHKVKQVNTGDPLQVQVADGHFKVIVQNEDIA